MSPSENYGMLSNEAQASRALVAAFADDPFYRAITVDIAEEGERSRVLEAYFRYSIREGQQYGFSTIREGSFGAAIWLKPQAQVVQEQALEAKYTFLTELLTSEGFRNYQQIIAFMSPRAEALVGAEAWFLSILGVSPDAQGKGMGASLVTPGTALADQHRATCFLETFNTRALNFYQRLGFQIGEQHHEPTTKRDYWILVRQPNRE